MSYPFICHKRGSLTFEFLESQCKRRDLDFAPDMEPETSELVLELVKHGFGIGFMPEQTAAPALTSDDVFALHLKEPLPKRSISLLEYDGHTLSLAARRLRDILTEDAEQ